MIFLSFSTEKAWQMSHMKGQAFFLSEENYTQKKTTFKKLSAVDATGTLMCLSHLQTTFWFFFYISLRLEISCEWFTWNIKPHFLWKKKIRLSSATILLNTLTLSSLQTITNTFANSADQDEMACNELSHQDLHCLPFWYWFLLKPLFASMDMSKFRVGRFHFQKLWGERVKGRDHLA